MKRETDFETIDGPALVRDSIDETLELWSRHFPEIDLEPLGVILRISRLGLMFTEGLQNFVRPYGITAGEMDVMFCLLRSGAPYEQRPSDIAKGCHVTTGATTGRVNRLIDSGLVERTNSSKDRRELRVQLTAKGRKLARKLRREVAVAPFASDVLDTMGPQDRAELIRLMRTFSIGMQQLRPRL